MRTLSEILSGLSPARRATVERRYQELIMAVEQKVPGETRHETALRYIKEHGGRS